jgi:flagellar biosynthesis protein FlhG
MVKDRPQTVEDQAAGLRRLFTRRPNQVIAFASGRSCSGLTSLLVQTAVALAEGGQRVLLIDENSGAGSAMATLGIQPPGDLWDSLIGRVALERSIVSVSQNLWAVSAVGTAERLYQDSPVVREKLNMLMTPMRGGSDFILIDSHLSHQGHLSILSSTARHMVVIVSAETTSITDSYGLIKRLVKERGREGFQVVITRPKSEEDARMVFDNLKRTAGQHLGVSLHLLAIVRIPTAENIAEAIYAKLPFATEQSAV